jgi:calcineurin-like phosphoesterase family protein
MDIWFTSDNHFDHDNIIIYESRPFASTLEMNEVMIERWNKVVKPGDQVYHLGDLMLGPGATIRARLAELRRRLNGHVTIILGNHDRGPKTYLAAGFERAMRSFLCNDGRTGLINMRHRPPVVRGGDMIHLCGHVHSLWKRQDNVINVGVDVWNFTPVSLDTLLKAT